MNEIPFARIPPRPLGLLPLLLGLGSTVAALAQPIITGQPRSLAVLLGSNATFRVTATSATPLAYQWRSAAGNLSGATNATLVLSNVALGHLGGYAVAVSDATGQSQSQVAWLKLARWTEFVYFGDSECQTNESNGPTWGDYLPDLLCLPGSGKRIYFTGAAGEADVRSQIQSYLSTCKPGTNTIVAMWKGGMIGDLLVQGYPAERAVSNRVANLARLADAGIRSFLVPKQCSLRLWPAVAAIPSSQNLSNYDRLLDSALQEFAHAREADVIRPDMKAFEDALWAAPADYGFTNLTGNAQTLGPCEPDRCYHWDGFHVTTTANRLWSEVIYRSIIPPLLVKLKSQESAGVLELQWHGGAPPFCMQWCQDPTVGHWQSGELTFQNNTTIANSAPLKFFRVIQLGQ